MNLETYQRGLQRLVTQGQAAPEDAAYLQQLAGCTQLAVVREIVYFWRAHGLERFCILSASLLKSLGRFENAIERFVSTEKFSPFIEEASQQFLQFLTKDQNSIVAALAKTEIALHETRTNILTEIVVEWPCNPEPILLAIVNATLVNQLDINQELFAPESYRLRISRALANGYACELVETL